jgi:rhamnose transport system ATP-binding protein
MRALSTRSWAKTGLAKAPGTKAEIYALFNELVQEGIGILVISSDLPEVLALADRVLIMRHGHLTGELARADATGEKVVHLAALGTAEGNGET